jgi:two-component system chemotaxis response regulator CheY
MQGISMNGNVADGPLKLPTILDLAAADEFLASVRQRTGNGTPLCVDAAAVETLTLPCMQIMLAAARSHGRIAVKNPSAAFICAFEDLGIDWMQDLDCSQAQDAELSQAENHQSQCSEAAEQPAIDEGGMQCESADHDLEQISESAMSTRILTIDDSKTMRDMLMLTLAEAGFDVLQAVDGQDGLDVLVKERVDVVITDINMPRMDGYEVIRQLRRKPEHKSTPILVLTTESETEKKDLAREAGATGWLVKPFDPDRLVATVRKVAP